MSELSLMIIDVLTTILDILIVTGKHIIENAGAIATLAGAFIGLYALNRWKREYKFKHDSELLEEALVLFYQADRAIAYLRNGFIFAHEIKDFEFPSELEEDRSKERYKYTYTIQKRFDEKQDIFNKLDAIELRFRVRFGADSIKAFISMREKVKRLLLAANQYSWSGLDTNKINDVQRVIWKDYNLPDKNDVFGDDIEKIVKDFDNFCRDKMR